MTAEVNVKVRVGFILGLLDLNNGEDGLDTCVLVREDERQVESKVLNLDYGDGLVFEDASSGDSRHDNVRCARKDSNTIQPVFQQPWCFLRIQE